MRHRLAALAALVVAPNLASASAAAIQLGSPPCCPQCRLQVLSEEYDKTCFEVKQRIVCIPAVTFPWQPQCDPPTAFVRVVNVLEKRTYRCRRCKYQWTPITPACDSCLSTSSQLAPTNRPAPPTLPALPPRPMEPIESVPPRETSAVDLFLPPPSLPSSGSVSPTPFRNHSP